MAELDPYATLGVQRTAARAEIARAYRALAKRHHPDAGAPPSPTMSRINEAWYVLSDPTRRARWDRAHLVVAPPHWSPGPPAGRSGEVYRRPVATPSPEPGRADRGWVVASIVTAVAVLLAGVMVAVTALATPADTRASFADEHLTFRYPADWTLLEGEAGQDPAHEVLAHLVSFPITSDERCTSFEPPTDPCAFGPNGVPPGQASLVITAREGGTPPVPEPVTRRPAGLDADAIIGGEPAVVEIGRTAAGTLDVWWQLSPPGFPDRWIEIRAELGGRERDLEAIQFDVQSLIDSIEFAD